MLLFALTRRFAGANVNHHEWNRSESLARRLSFQQ